MILGFFQYELSHPNNAPHVGQCLLLDDLRRAGHEVDAALVHVGAVDAMIDRIRERRYDLVAVDAIFTKPVIGRIKAAVPDVPILVGGNNALALFLAAPVDLAIVGPGRQAMRALVDALQGDGDPSAVPNLWTRTDDGRLDTSGVTLPWSFDPELSPFRPDLDWGYLGPSRDPGANTRFSSVVPEWGCAFRADSLIGEAYADLPRGVPSDRVASLRLTDRARTATQKLVDDTRGCAFCTFRYQPYTIDAVDAVVDRLMHQIRSLHDRYGVSQISIQSEYPFRFLSPLVARLKAESSPIDTLLLRTFPAILAANPESVLTDFQAAIDAGLSIHLQQLGFENFVSSELDRLGKGIPVTDNVAAAEVLRELHRRFGDRVNVFKGHGFILFTPWTTPEDIAENIRVVREHAPFLAPSLGLASRLCFYDPFNPIFRLAEREGLTVDSPNDYGMDFRFADPRTDRLCRLALALEGTMVQRGAHPGPTLQRAVLTAVTPLFLDDAVPRTDEELFLAAESAAAENLTRDAVLWPES